MDAISISGLAIGTTLSNPENSQILNNEIKTPKEENLEDFLTSPKYDKLFSFQESEIPIDTEIETVDIKPNINVVKTKANTSRNRSISKKKLLQCTFCNKKFKKQGCFDKHMNQKHRDYNPPFKCDYCKKTYMEKKRLTGHILSLHLYNKKKDKNKKIHKCNVCDKIFSWNYFTHHIKIHEKNPYHCDCCRANFSTKKSLTLHILISHLNEKKFTCSKCGRKFSRKSDYNVHLERHSKGLPLYCKIDYDIGIKKKDDSKPYHCTICPKKYKIPSDLLDHIKHHGEKTYKCDVCQKMFYTKKDVTLHMIVHTASKTFQCEDCGEVYFRNSQLKCHINAKHTKTKLFKCSECDKVYMYYGNLQDHMQTHSEKKVMCEHCGKLFSSNKNLKGHILQCHQKDSEAYRRLCKLKLERAKRLKENPKYFQCELCPKKYTNSSVLSNHKKTHGEKEHKCTLCPKAYHFKKSLVFHMQSHVRKNLKSKKDCLNIL